MKNLIRVLGVLLLLMEGITTSAQQQIAIETEKVSLVFTVGTNGRLYQSYLGKKLSAPSKALLSPGQGEAYVPSGGDNLFEPAVRMIHADGNPSLELVYESHAVKNEGGNTTTSIVLKDMVYPVKVVLHFSAFSKENVLKEWVEISHIEKAPVQLTHFASSMLHFKADDYWLTQFHGDWAEEMHVSETKLTSGIKIIDSKLGTRANMYQTPAFALATNRPATEEEGEVLLGTLAWTGNFQFAFEVDEKQQLRVISGMNPFASEYTLEPKKNFTTPAFIFTYSDKGKGQASRNLHAWGRNYGVLNGNKERMTLLNNWEATQFDFDEKKLIALFGEAKELGVDMFLLDDGWFGNKYPRHSDNAGLGDWDANKKILPNGVSALVKGANEKGVKFGIWIEPEMVNPKSELYEKHPDWVLKLPNRKEHYFRNQLVLDLINPQVQDFVYKLVDDLLTSNPGIAYIKWDCNRMMTNTYSPFLKNKQSQVYIDYVKGFYAVMERIRKKYPALPIMLCSGGGGRTDYGALQYFTEFWPSDNTDAVERIFIQWGYSYFFPANTIAAHITSWGKQPLKFRTDVAMMGRLGYDINLAHLSETDITFSKAAVKKYKELGPVIGQGDLFRLIAPTMDGRAALMYVDSLKQKAVLFAYTLHPRYGENWSAVKLKGLDPLKKYLVNEANIYPGTNPSLAENGKTFTGEYLMENGLMVSQSNALSSAVIELTEVK